MYALIPIYLVVPFLKKLVDTIDKKQVIYLFALWILCSIFYTTVQNLFPVKLKNILSFNNTFNLNFIGGYIGFFILGYYLHTKEVRVKNIWLILISILDVIIIAAGTYVATSYYNGYFEGFKVYTGVFTALLSVCVFLIFKNLSYEAEHFKFSGITDLVGAMSFPIYLIHNLIIDFLNVTGIIQPEKGIVYILLRFVLVFAISYVIVYVLSKIKPLCFVSTGIKYRGLNK